MKTIVRACSVLFASLFIFATVQGQDSDYEIPRTIDGHPDLQGVWENNTITPVERPDVFGDKEFLTDEDIDLLRCDVASLLPTLQGLEEDGLVIFAGLWSLAYVRPTHSSLRVACMG